MNYKSRLGDNRIMKNMIFYFTKKIIKKLVFKLICMSLIHKTEENVDKYLLPLVIKIEKDNILIFLKSN